MIVVTGPTGNVGRELVSLLAAAGERVTAVSRSAADLPDGAAHHQADLADPKSLKPAFDGADTLFMLTPGPSLDLAGILETAKAGGVSRVVLLSSLRAATRREEKGVTAFEDAVTASGLASTILRPGGFDSNALLWADSVRTRRTIAAPFGDVGLPLIDPTDIAAVAAGVLRDGDHVGREYHLTGPAPITPRQQAAAIGDALGEPVTFVEQTREQARAELTKFWPEVIVDGTLKALGEPNAAERAVSPDVEQLLGRAPRSFADWVARNIAAFA